MMSAKLIVLLAVIAVAQCRVKPNPLYRYLDNVAKREPGTCAYQCVPTCYDDGYGSYNHRSGSCSKAGYSCCEWQVGKREESKQDLSAKREPGACAYECVPTCYDDGYGSYNHRSGSCSKAGYSCCEWQVGKREESKQDLSVADPMMEANLK
ncbi:hypothetical protein OS493_011183 [Desmophyllum pertusum]|uniref:Uncharacterized protein n=1 Tax=Desmophyllum pertusum TaxID=174260 RepID=A0A9W9Z1F2_9CNID|nr:hypothetical protein OS493_011183 [Desmophyllum pertusum]